MLSSFVDIVSTPQPHWKPGQPQPSPHKDQKIRSIDPSGKSVYHLVTSAIVPRPIAFLSSVSKEGRVNLAPFSYFNSFGHAPPVIGVGICRNLDGSKKDSLVNVEQTKEFVVSIIGEWFVEAANHCSGNFKPDENEFDISGLTEVPSVKVKAPRVAESGFNMECKLLNTVDVKNAAGNVTTTVVIAEVVMFHVTEDILDENGAVDIQKYRPVSRLGGDRFSNVREGWDLQRPKL